MDRLRVELRALRDASKTDEIPADLDDGVDWEYIASGRRCDFDDTIDDDDDDDDGDSKSTVDRMIDQENAAYVRACAEVFEMWGLS